MTEHRPPGSFSPELALVDPAAAEEGRSDLPDVVLTEDATPWRRPGEHSIDGVRRRVPWTFVGVAVLAGVAVVIGIGLGSGAHDNNSTPTAATRNGATVAARTIPDFVWVPATNAARYRVEFVRDGRLVLQKTTAAPRLHVVASTLPPGRYRWHVWALDADGTRLGAAVVDATVDIA